MTARRNDHIEVLTARLEVEVAALKALVDERHERYTERERADNELMAERERRHASERASDLRAVADAFANGKEAITKAENSQTVYNETHNDLLRKMETRDKETMPRHEIEARLKALEEKIGDLRESRSVGRGYDEAVALARTTQRWIVGLALTLVLSLVGTAIAFLRGAAP